MSNLKLNQVSQHNHIVIVAIAFSGLLVLGFVGMVEQARAQTSLADRINLPQLFNRVINIPIPCQPYCNIDDDRLDRVIVTPVGTIRINFSFLSMFRG